MIDDAARAVYEAIEEAECSLRSALSESDIADILRKHFQPAPGIERPDAPGVWFRDGVAWLVRSPAIQDVMFATEVGEFGYTGTTVAYQDLPPGNWRRAVPQKGGE